MVFCHVNDYCPANPSVATDNEIVQRIDYYSHPTHSFRDRFLTTDCSAPLVLYAFPNCATDYQR